MTPMEIAGLKMLSILFYVLFGLITAGILDEFKTKKSFTIFFLWPIVWVIQIIAGFIQYLKEL